MKKILIGAGIAAAVALTGCQAETPVDSFSACMVGGASGFEDRAFNQVSHEGLLRAKEKLGVEVKTASSKAEADYAKDIQSMVDAKCDIIITVGSQFGETTEAAAKKSPGIQFAIVDTAYDAPPANLRSLLFKTEEPSFMAGYAAASLSKSGTVATFGGRQVPAVTAFMSGFVQGVEYYNEQHGASIKAIGWDGSAGEFVQSDRPFADPEAAKAVAQGLADQGADIILAAAGGSGQGALDLAKESNGALSIIWVDTDGAVSQEGFAPVIPTSVVKAADVAVYEAIKSAKAGDFSNEAYVGTLANQGTYLAPFHDFDAQVSDATRTELDRLKYDIQMGNITINL